MTAVLAAHLLATDISGLALFEHCSDLQLTGVIVPANRSQSEKTEILRGAAAERGLPLAVQPRGGNLPIDLPAADVAISWMYSQILPADDLLRYRFGMLNMHGGHIPRYRGANVLQWAIINGESELWVTWHEIVAEVDAGAIWAEAPLPVPLDWTAFQARAAMIEAGISLFPQAWQRKRDGLSPVRIPNLSHGRVWPSRRPRDGDIQPGWSARQLRDFLRALCPPWPLPTWQGRSVVGISTEAGVDSAAYTCKEGVVLYLHLGPQV
ncbi:formyltransferase family protein [Ferrovibrio sp.]|uniref:formyltransferase family protein n=1 Tax=Ferrovibrio sp. TaxID=1917215 RepID=UPI0025B8636D|nr:formyltransferase family protein [Ferrovibrio sp.]MBX3456240.1 hypothetical protein [Ferrovibrio sp.]